MQCRGAGGRGRGTQGARHLRKLEVGARRTVAPVCTAATAAAHGGPPAARGSARAPARCGKP